MTIEEDRIKDVSGELAWTFLLLSAKGETVRASQALWVLQRLWNAFPAWHATPPYNRAVTVDGIYGSQSASVVRLSLRAARIFDLATVNTVPSSASQLRAWVNANRDSAATHSTPSYDLATRAPADRVASVLENWAYRFVEIGPAEAYGEQGAVLSPPSTVEDIDRAAAQQDRLPTRGGAATVILPGDTVVGIAVGAQRRPLWPWAVAASGLGILTIGAVFYFKKRRR